MPLIHESSATSPIATTSPRCLASLVQIDIVEVRSYPKGSLRLESVVHLYHQPTNYLPSNKSTKSIEYSYFYLNHHHGRQYYRRHVYQHPSGRSRVDHLEQYHQSWPTRRQRVSGQYDASVLMIRYHHITQTHLLPAFPDRLFFAFMCITWMQFATWFLIKGPRRTYNIV